MKKTFLIGISLMAIIFFAATTQVNAQWSAKVTWDDAECSCSAVVLTKTVEWALFKYGTTTVVDQGAVNLPYNALNEYTIQSSSVQLIPDARYTLCVRVFYKVPSEAVACCKGETCVDTDSGELTGTPLLPIHVILQ